MSKQTQPLTSHQLLHKVIEFGLNTILESKSLNVDTAVKNDLLAELNTTNLQAIGLSIDEINWKKTLMRRIINVLYNYKRLAFN